MEQITNFDELFETLALLQASVSNNEQIMNNYQLQIMLNELQQNELLWKHFLLEQQVNALKDKIKTNNF